MTRIPTLGPRGEGWVAAQLALILLVAVLGAMNLPTATAGLVPWPVMAAGAVLFVLGGWVALRGIRDLGTNMSALPHPREDASLVRDGIYRRTRHPIYAGLIGLGVGWALVTVSPWALGAAFVLTIVLDLKARREEIWLASSYHDYAAYRAMTHRFIPGVY